MKARPVIILAVCVFLIVGGAIWFLQTGPQPAPVDPAVKTETVEKQPAAVTGPRGGTPIPRGTDATSAAPAPAKKPAPDRAMQEWEMRIDQVLQAKATETEAAQMLINMLPSLPPEGQAEAAQHISNLILDKDYNRVLPLLRNPSLPEEVHDVLVTDLMNREDQVKLPALLDVAKIPNHPYHEEALTDLQIFLDEDNGQDWNKWQLAMKKYLANLAKEEALLNETVPGTPAILPPGQ